MIDPDYRRGLAIRRQVMGAAHVDRALGEVSDFAAPLQEFITRCAWGSIWSRPGLDRKSRSLVTLAFLTAQGRSHELAGHLRGARNNGASVEEIREVLLQAAVYCGVPLAAEALRVAESVLLAGEAG